MKHVHHWILDDKDHGVCIQGHCRDERTFTNAQVTERVWNAQPLRNAIMSEMRVREHQAMFLANQGR